MKFKVALLQISPAENHLENFEIASKYIAIAKKNNADIALLPELWNVGYVSPENNEIEWKKSAYKTGDENFSKYVILAKELGIAIAFPYLETEDGKYYNSVALIDKNGKMLMNYRKVHTVDKGWEKVFSQGDEFKVVELEIGSGILKIGFMICFDREFPEAARILMLGGAEIVLVPNACTLENNRINQFQTRGFENMMGVAMTNYPSPKFNGHSVAFDGMREKGVDYNPLIVLGGEDEGILYADFDIDKLRKYRESEIWGDSFRQPLKYSKILENKPEYPFIREDARR
jgi:predicted amidohydrolase